MRARLFAVAVVLLSMTASALALASSGPSRPEVRFRVVPAIPAVGQPVRLVVSTTRCAGCSVRWYLVVTTKHRDRTVTRARSMGSGRTLRTRFSTPGVRTIRVVARDDHGRRARRTKRIRVVAVPTQQPGDVPGVTTPIPIPSVASAPPSSPSLPLPPPPAPAPIAQPSCVAGATTATTAAQVRSGVSAGQNVCVTAAVGNVNLDSLTSGSVRAVGTQGAGSMGEVSLNSSSRITLRARMRSLDIRNSSYITIEQSVIGGTSSNRVTDQLIFIPVLSTNVTIRDNDIGWTNADNSGNTGYGIRFYDAPGVQIVGNKIHDVAADGIQGLGGGNVLIDRNEIGPVGANPSSSEHSDAIQVVGNDGGDRITNNYLHDQGYYAGSVTGNAGIIYVHGGTSASLLIENNLFTHSQGRTEICGLGTGGTSRSNVTIRSNTWQDLGLAYTGFPGFEWDCDSGTGNTIERNIAVDPDRGFAQNGSLTGVSNQNNLFGSLSLVTLDAQGNCTSANCNGATPIGYRKPAGVHW